MIERCFNVNNRKIIEIFPNKYEFITTTIWSNDAIKKTKKQLALICIRETATNLQVIHPLSNFIINWKWKDRAYNTQRKQAKNIVRFLNYLLSKGMVIKSLSNLTIEIGNEYLDSMVSEGRRRDTVTDAGRSLTAFYVWLSKQGLLTEINENFIESKKYTNPKTYKSFYESLFSPILPPKMATNRKHLIPTKYIPLLLEIATLYAHPIVLGIYLQIFGGLRAGEVVNLKRTQIKKKLDSGDFLLDIKEKNFRMDLKDSSGAIYVKKNRKQQVLQIKDWGEILYKEHFEIYKDQDITNTGALFINRDGLPMSGKSYCQYFYKVKDKFVNFLRDYGTAEDRIIAADLRISNWGTHIGRGTFTNLIAEEIENPAELMFLRGDSDLLSSLPYLAKTDRVRKKIEDRLQKMHEEYVPTLVLRKTENNR